MNHSSGFLIAQRWWRPVSQRGGTFVVLLASLWLTACAAIPPRPNSVLAADRRQALPTSDHVLFAAVTIRWDDRMVPFIEAADDRDVPYVIGLLHAHLRRGQMELLRLASQGRLAEAAGPLALPIDRAIRTLGINRATEAMAADLKDPAAAWLQRYVDGLNAVVGRSERPWEMRLGGLEDTPWTVRDVLAIGRVAAIDPNWFGLIAQARLEGDPQWAEARARLVAAGAAVPPSFDGAWPLDAASMVGRTGSNAVVVSGWRRGGGGALLAADPHLGFIQPNTWLAMGWRSPAGAVAGLTVPGIPLVLTGRNEHIAKGRHQFVWGGICAVRRQRLAGARGARNAPSSLVVRRHADPAHDQPWRLAGG